MWNMVYAIPIIWFFFYCQIPNWWLRNHSQRVLRNGNKNGFRISLTFDDGPHPLYTQKILDILREFDVSATFFVVGKQALAYPDLIRSIHAQGHSLGCHSFSHRHAWLMSPFMVFNDMKAVYSLIKNITGHPPKWYRPPWGTFNLLSTYAANRLQMIPTYWSVAASDWKQQATAENISAKVLSATAPGSIIVLHDYNGSGRKLDKTIEALPCIINSLKNSGCEFVTLEELKEGFSC